MASRTPVAVAAALVLLMSATVSSAASTTHIEVVSVHGDGTHRTVLYGPSALTIDLSSFGALIRSSGGRWYAYPTPSSVTGGAGSGTGLYVGTIDTIATSVPAELPLPVFAADSDADGPRMSFSPAARRIAFMQWTCVAPECSPVCSPRCGQTRIVVARSDGTDMHTVAEHGRSPVWSSDGRWIAFRGHVGDLNDGHDTGLTVVRPDGSGLRRIAAAGGDPAFAPTGSRLAYACATAVCVASVDGTARQTLTTGTTRWIANPSWSPDGTRLAAYACDGRACDLVVGPVKGGALRTIRRNVGAGLPPMWSPTGERIAFLGVNGGYDVVPAGGGRAVTLVKAGIPAVALRWSSASTLTYVTYDSGG